MTGMIRMVVRFPALERWGHSVRIGTHDTGYLLHAAMRAAFGSTAPQPFCLLERQGEILGYGVATEEELRTSLESAGQVPGGRWLHEAFTLPTPCRKLLPSVWTPGALLRFSVLTCPLRRFKSTRVGREGRTQEKDAFLLTCEKARKQGAAEPTREEAYKKWLEEQLARDGAATLQDYAMTGFRLTKSLRRGAAGHGGAPYRLEGVRPEALFEGLLRIADGAAFSTLVARGVGRHRAFGYGMLLLRAV